MIERESLMAELDAARVFEVHQEQFISTIYIYGERKTVATLHALADLIESREFAFTAETVH